LQRLGKKSIRKLIWTKQRVCGLFKTCTLSSGCMAVSSSQEAPLPCLQ
jgi:hypothetical protein